MLNPTFRILTGARAGAVYKPTTEIFVAGRQASAELRFDAEKDLSVSSRHARFVRRTDGWTVEDLGSRNGTFVNGRAITSEVLLKGGDHISFGVDGPEVEYAGVGQTPATAAMPVADAIRRERRRTNRGVLVLFSLLVATVAFLVIKDARTVAKLREQRVLLEKRVDSMLARGASIKTSLSDEVTGLSAALKESEERLQQLRSRLAAPTAANAANNEELQRDLVATAAALQRQQLAASLDFELIQRRARGAVAMVWVEYSNGDRITGTAFAVRPNGTLLTTGHLVKGSSGNERVARIAVRFADSDQAFPARLLAVSQDFDLAALKVENLVGEVPAISGFNTRSDTIAAGTAVALIGYPLGGEPEGAAGMIPRVAHPVVSTALVLRWSQDLEIQGLGAAGASGSPVLDGAGEVIAILFGGRNDDGVQVLLAVPARAASTFLNTVRW